MNEFQRILNVLIRAGVPPSSGESPWGRHRYAVRPSDLNPNSRARARVSLLPIVPLQNEAASGTYGRPASAEKRKGREWTGRAAARKVQRTPLKPWRLSGRFAGDGTRRSYAI